MNIYQEKIFFMLSYHILCYFNKSLRKLFRTISVCLGVISFAHCSDSIPSRYSSEIIHCSKIKFKYSLFDAICFTPLYLIFSACQRYFFSKRVSSVTSIGFAVCAFIPHARQRCMSSEKASALIAIIGTDIESKRSSCLIASAASYPVIFGILISIRIAS